MEVLPIFGSWDQEIESRTLNLYWEIETKPQTLK